jgi:hypothetical protein
MSFLCRKTIAIHVSIKAANKCINHVGKIDQQSMSHAAIQVLKYTSGSPWTSTSISSSSCNFTTLLISPWIALTYSSSVILQYQITSTFISGDCNTRQKQQMTKLPD